MTSQSNLEPTDLEWLDKGVLGITWSDGHKGVYPVRYLRQHCPVRPVLMSGPASCALKMLYSPPYLITGRGAGRAICLSIQMERRA